MNTLTIVCDQTSGNTAIFELYKDNIVCRLNSCGRTDAVIQLPDGAADILRAYLWDEDAQDEQNLHLDTLPALSCFPNQTGQLSLESYNNGSVCAVVLSEGSRVDLIAYLAASRATATTPAFGL